MCACGHRLSSRAGRVLQLGRQVRRRAMCALQLLLPPWPCWPALPDCSAAAGPGTCAGSPPCKAAGWSRSIQQWRPACMQIDARAGVPLATGRTCWALSEQAGAEGTGKQRQRQQGPSAGHAAFCATLLSRPSWLRRVAKCTRLAAGCVWGYQYASSKAWLTKPACCSSSVSSCSTGRAVAAARQAAQLCPAAELIACTCLLHAGCCTEVSSCIGCSSWIAMVMINMCRWQGTSACSVADSLCMPAVFLPVVPALSAAVPL